MNYADNISAGTQFYLRPKIHSAVLEVPDVSESDTTKVMEWIKLQMTREETPFCWRDSYGRGVGVIPTTCPSGKEKIGELCYSKCPSGTFLDNKLARNFNPPYLVLSYTGPYLTVFFFWLKGTVRFGFDCHSVCPKA